VGMCRWNICVVIRLETLWLNCSTWLRMYRRNALLDQRPIIMIWQTKQLLKNMAIAAPDLIECVPISDFLIFKVSSPMATIASFMAAVTCADVTWLIRLKRQKADMGVLLLAFSYDLILRTMAAAIRMGHMLMSPDALWVTVLFFSSFFCISNVIDMQYDCIAKKIATVVSCPMAFCNSVVRRFAISAITHMGMAFCCFCLGSSLAYD
jgi:hypothetical protein